VNIPQRRSQGHEGSPTLRPANPSQGENPPPPNKGLANTQISEIPPFRGGNPQFIQTMIPKKQ
jgi:hypothetical protein